LVAVVPVLGSAAAVSAAELLALSVLLGVVFVTLLAMVAVDTFAEALLATLTAVLAGGLVTGSSFP